MAHTLTPVTQVLQAILDKSTTEEGRSRKVLSYRRDFDEFWNAVKSEGDRKQDFPSLDGEDGIDLVVVWDGVPETKGKPSSACEAPSAEGESPINVSDHLTVFDWLVALCCKVSDLALNESKCLPSLRVFVLDLSPPQHSAAFAVGAFPEFLSRIPWVRVYRPATPRGEHFRRILADTPAAARIHRQDVHESSADSADAEKVREQLRDAQLLLRHAYLPETLDVERLMDEFEVGAAASEPLPSVANDKRLSETADLLRNVWSAQLTKPGDRHSIANLIGPSILLEAMGRGDLLATRDSRLLTALRVLMKALGLVPEHSGEERAPWIPRQRWEKLVDRFILVDDMADQGWRYFLEAALEIDDGEQLACSPTPDRNGFGPKRDTSIIDILTDKADSPGAGQPTETLRINQPLRLTTDSHREVLFLDLRLFANRLPEEELAFFRRLLPLAEQAAYGTKGLPWDGFHTQEISQIRRHTETPRLESVEYHTALTMLPRLIALCDPTLPIVLFSSTGQKHIAEALKPHGNIIVLFDKPRPFGHSSSDLARDTRTRFTRTLQQALFILRGRNICGRLRQAHADALRHHATTPVQHSSATAPFVEVYIEESGAPGDRRGFRVGGLICCYPSKAIADTLWRALSSHTLVWGLHTDAPWEPVPTPYLKKASDTQDAEVQSECARLAELCDARGVTCTAFALESTPSQLAHSLIRWAAPDALFRTLVRDALDVILFEWLPRMVANPPADVSIFVANRSLVEDDPNILLQAARNFGLVIDEDFRERGAQFIEVFEDEATVQSAIATLSFANTAFTYRGRTLRWIVNCRGVGTRAARSKGSRKAKKLLCYSFNCDDVYPIVSEILSQRPDTSHLRIAAAKGVAFKYYGKNGSPRRDKTPDELPRQIHYAADWVVSKMRLVPEDWRQRGFVEEHGRAFAHLLSACRLAEKAQGALAISEWSLAVSHGAHGGRGGTLARWCAERVGECARQLSGSEFLELCDYLDAEDRKRTLLLYNIPGDLTRENLMTVLGSFGVEDVGDVRAHRSGVLWTDAIFRTAHNAGVALDALQRNSKGQRQLLGIARDVQAIRRPLVY